MNSTAAAIPGHMPQLDGLRAIAVLVVIFHHSVNWWWCHHLPAGVWGVRLFFVLSGFLITGILIDARQKAESLNYSLGRVAASFYGRRVVRIFPAYYTAILILAIAGLSAAAGGLWWDVAYLSNIKILLQGNWPLHTAHFWSLAVEEQFYLFWPFVILFTPRRLLLSAIVSAIVLAPAARIGLYALTRSSVATSVQMISCLDCLAAGALLAWAWKYDQRVNVMKWRQPTLVATVVAGIGVFVYSQVLVLPFSMTLTEVSGNLLYAVVFFWVIDAAAAGIPGRVGMLLQSTAALAIGRISYGMYVYHVMAIDLLKAWGVEVGGVLFFTATVMTVVFAALSWVIVERPMNNLKRLFPYVRRPSVVGAAPIPHAAE